ncbi:MAG: hypothetical protein SGI97_02795 [candidate division Zixibacteria bacterium]|nr:hypothetical protein [candidate division Zixibacteria bacterium]
MGEPIVVADSGMGNFGVIISILLLAGGLIWLAWRSISGREVDRRVIYLFVALAVTAPILFPITFPEKTTQVVQNLFDKIETLPSGSFILLSFDFDPALAPEVQPMADAITRHCLAKNHKIVFMSLWATGQAQMNQTLRRVVNQEFPDKLERIDYVNVGYKAGNEGVLRVIATDFPKMFPSDVNNVPYPEIPMLGNIRSCSDFDLLVMFGGGKPGPMEWVLFVGDPTGVPLGACVAAVSAPQLYSYYPKQMIGILGGIKGAAEYESELARVHDRFKTTPAPGLKMMGPQTLVHVVIMAFIVLGNVVYFRGRRRSAA